MTKTSLLSISIVIGLFISAVPDTLASQRNTKAIYDDGLEVRHFEELGYPVSARLARTQGVVVVEATLDGAGNVVSVEPISGPRNLIETAVSNVHKWKFAAGGRKRVVVVYDFSIDDGRCQDGMRSLFRLRHANTASITACGGRE